MKTDAQGRRLRFAPPNPQVKRLVLTEADHQIFEAIHRHGPLSSHFLYEFTKHLRKDKTHLQNRLTEFYNGDSLGPFLIRPPQQFAGFEARYQHIVYDLAPRAKAALADLGIPARTTRRTDPFLHQLMQACVGASLELHAPSKGIRYISRDEILRHPKCGLARDAKNPMAIPLSGERTLVPDDLFGLEYAGQGFRFFAVEIDRNTESIERTATGYNTFGKKIEAYLEVLRRRCFQSWWGIPNLSVLTVTTNGTHARNIIDFIRRQNEPKYAERFAFAWNPDFGSNWRVPRTILVNLLDDALATPGAPKHISRP